MSMEQEKTLDELLTDMKNIHGSIYVIRALIVALNKYGVEDDIHIPSAKYGVHS